MIIRYLQKYESSTSKATKFVIPKCKTTLTNVPTSHEQSFSKTED